MQKSMNKSSLINEIRKLGITERLNILSLIWDEIKESKVLETIPEEDERLLMDRLANYRQNPSSASDWTELKKEVYEKYKQS